MTQSESCQCVCGGSGGAKFAEWWFRQRDGVRWRRWSTGRFIYCWLRLCPLQVNK